MTEWQPIETAPKDGQVIIVARHMGENWGWVLGTSRWVDVRGIAGWVSRGLSEPPGELGLAHPTHWALIDRATLPTPPEEG